MINDNFKYLSKVSLIDNLLTFLKRTSHIFQNCFVICRSLAYQLRYLIHLCFHQVILLQKFLYLSIISFLHLLYYFLAFSDHFPLPEKLLYFKSGRFTIHNIYKQILNYLVNYAAALNLTERSLNNSSQKNHHRHSWRSTRFFIDYCSSTNSLKK